VFGGILIASIFIIVFFIWQRKVKFKQRLNYIDHYIFHQGIRQKVLKKHPNLTDEQLNQVFIALKDFFKICLLAKKNRVAMPSRVVDDAWHEFILSTYLYQKFCQRALGRFLHHTPTEVMMTPTSAQESIKRAWRLSCASHHIDPKHPQSLPLLFKIDHGLNIKNGFIYYLDCKNTAGEKTGNTYCVSHIGCVSSCYGDSGGDSIMDSSFSGDSGGDDAGNGCSGSCSGSCGGD